MLDSVEAVNARWGDQLTYLEWFFTAVFTIEYVLRLLCVRHPARYARSVFGVIDLVSILPTYLALFFPALHLLIDVRVLRMLRIFRILKLGAYVADVCRPGQSHPRHTAQDHRVFVFFMIVVAVMGTLMYVVEGPANGFTSVPVSIYWSISTLATVGFGDITPETDLGRFIASVMMLMGWGTLAVPAGIVSAEFAVRRTHPQITARTCHECLSEGHEPQAKFCGDCGAGLPPYQVDSGEN